MDIEQIVKDIPEEERKFLDESIERHRLTPHVSLEVYRREKVYELETLLRGRKLVYLDTKYWIWLRDPTLSTDPVSLVALKNLLSSGVSRGQLLCPFSLPAYTELMLQHPTDMRLATAKLMDELSLGITLKNFNEIAGIEYTRFFTDNHSALKHLAHCSLPVWTRAGALFGEMYPEHSSLPKDFQTELKKVVFDSFWARKIEDLARLPDIKKNITRVAEQIKGERQKHPRNNQSFDNLYRGELNDVLDFHVKMIERSLLEIGSMVGIAPDSSGAFGSIPSHVFVNLIREVTTQKKDTKAIPSQRIQAALHAAIRMDDNRPFKENDAEDINHASTALAYCHVFLTERSLANLAQTKEVKDKALSACKVAWKPQDAVAIVEDLMR